MAEIYGDPARDQPLSERLRAIEGDIKSLWVMLERQIVNVTKCIWDAIDELERQVEYVYGKIDG